MIFFSTLDSSSFRRFCSLVFLQSHKHYLEKTNKSFTIGDNLRLNDDSLFYHPALRLIIMIQTVKSDRSSFCRLSGVFSCEATKAVLHWLSSKLFLMFFSRHSLPLGFGVSLVWLKESGVKFTISCTPTSHFLSCVVQRHLCTQRKVSECFLAKTFSFQSFHHILQS